jgi:lysophospholipase L1-like esterase
MFDLGGGTNDIGINGDSAATVASSLSTWLDTIWALKEKYWCQIVVCSVLKRLDGNDSTVQAYNALIPGVIASKSYKANIWFVDMYNAVTRQVVGQGYNDVVHPNDEGYGNMATVKWANPNYQAALAAARPF